MRCEEFPLCNHPYNYEPGNCIEAIEMTNAHEDELHIGAVYDCELCNE